MWKKIIQIIKDHLPTVILGSILTLAISILSASYFFISLSPRSTEAKNTWVFKFIDSLHNQTIDMRMTFRGIEHPESPFAVLAIDDRSLEAVGRWPWPRNQVAELVENLYELGVKAVALDISFPEPTQDEFKAVLKGFSGIAGLDPESQKIVSEYSQLKSQELDNDANLARVFSENQHRLISASIYGIPRVAFAPYQNLCSKLVYQRQSYFNVWDEEQGYDYISLVDSSLEDKNLMEDLPEELENFLVERLDLIAKEDTEKFCETSTEKNCPDGLSTTSQADLNHIIADSQRWFCSAWLDPDGDRFYDEFLALASDQIQKIKSAGMHSALPRVDHWIVNIPKIQSSSRLSGFLNVHPDLDGTIRRLPLLVQTGSHILPSMGTRMAQLALGADGGQIRLNENALAAGFFEVTDFDFTKEAEPIQTFKPDRNANVRINFRGPRYTYPHISAKEILEPNNPNLRVTKMELDEGNIRLDRFFKQPKSFLKDKIVIIGLTAIGVYDLRVTPFDENYPGVEGHVTVADNLLKNDFFRSHRNESGYMPIFIFVAGLVLTLMYSALGAVTGLGVSLIAISTIVWADYTFLFKKGIVSAIFFPFLLLVLLYLTLTIFKYFTEERKKKKIRGTFEKYVSPAIVKEILQHPDNLKLGGRKEHISVFFSDVRGFTTISEALDPEDLSDLLNLYLTPMTDLVFSNNGTLDKYMGDAIMAFFGAPVSSGTHAEDACRCALQNLERLTELNQELESKSLPQIDVGIGINTGEMSVGNMGSQSVRNYTIMGDAVNLGARLEGINKQYGTRIIISEFTESELSETFKRREIDWVRVKGKEKPVRIFELMEEGELSEEKSELLVHFKRGFFLYHQMKWQQAVDEFKKGMEFVEEDPVSKLYIQRCHEFMSHPPEGDWDGVFVMKTK